ncbi:RNA polymerase sigma factor [Corynebacterium neomassiliense]|uniref:RNA polymerase sigma factor n=1 Tax=Corynebacterium neomassiliense TaxID=2079482 RepID=UPI001F025998|nr:sigma-70 family RNA polymerase sigma factor [Corynebacterium neomassiliense]
MIPLEEERELIERVRAADKDAFVALVQDARERVWGVCLGITGNRHDAEDAMQDAIATAWQGFDRFRGASRFSTWLYRIAANICRNKVSRRREFPDSDTGADLPTNTTDIGDRVADTQVVRWAVGQLSDEFREAVVLREIGGLSYREIALQQGVNIQTVKTRIFRARKALKELLGDRIGG